MTCNRVSAGFTYHGHHYTGDLAQVAQETIFSPSSSPNMASEAYRNNGMIVIWTDETEARTKTLQSTLTEVIISPLAKGNAYATTSITRTLRISTRCKNLPLDGFTPTGFLNDAANPSKAPMARRASASERERPTTCRTCFGRVIPTTIPTTQITPSGYVVNRRANTVTQTVTGNQSAGCPMAGPVYLVAGGLSATPRWPIVSARPKHRSARQPLRLVSGSALRRRRGYRHIAIHPANLRQHRRQPDHGQRAAVIDRF